MIARMNWHYDPMVEYFERCIQNLYSGASQSLRPFQRVRLGIFGIQHGSGQSTHMPPLYINIMFMLFGHDNGTSFEAGQC